MFPTSNNPFFPAASPPNEPMTGQAQTTPMASASRQDNRIAASIIEQGIVSDKAWHASGLPARRGDYVNNCLHQAALGYAAKQIGIGKEEYVQWSVNESMQKLPEGVAQLPPEKVKMQLAHLAAASWEEVAAPHIANWKGESGAEEYRRTAEGAEDRWNRWAIRHMVPLGSHGQGGRQWPSSVAPQPGAASGEARVRNAWAAQPATSTSDAGNARSEEESVFDPAFGAANLSMEEDDGSEEMATLDLSPAMDKGKGRAVTVPEEEHSPDRSISRASSVGAAPSIPLSRRNSLERLISETRETAQRWRVGKTAVPTLRTFSQRVDALNTKEGRSAIPAEAALALYKAQVAGRQAHPKEVKDPETGELVSLAAMRDREKQRDPETGDVIRRGALRVRETTRKRRRSNALATHQSGCQWRMLPSGTYAE